MKPKTGQNKRMKIPFIERKASFQPETYDEDSRTIDLIWTTGSRVMRGGFFTEPFMEELSMEKKDVRLQRLNAGAPLLNSHRASDLEDVIGVVENARMEDGKGLATVRFSDRESVQDIVKDVKAGILRNISVGYQVHKFEELDQRDKETDLPVFRATDWEPLEVSFVGIPADSGAQVRNNNNRENECVFITRKQMGETQMKDKKEVLEVKEPVKEIQPSVDATKVRQEAVASERKRVAEIREAATAAKMTAEFASELEEKGVSADEARKAILTKLQEDNNAPEVRTSSVKIEMGELDEKKTRKEGVQEALLHRYLPKHYELTDKGRKYRGMTLMRIAEEFVGKQAYGMSKGELCARALSTSDFAELLANTASKSLLRAYKVAPRTFLSWTRQGTLPDYKEASRVSFGDMASLEKVLEGDEYKYGSIGEAAEKIKLLKYGKIVKITEETLINDDLDAFTRLPAMVGAAGARLESKLVYTDTLLANPLMDQDGVALFHADHGNLGGALDVVEAGMTDLRSKMRNQTTVDGEDFLDLNSAFLMVGPAKETAARKILAGEVLGSTSADVNIFRNSHELIVEPRITGNQWYGAASPDVIDTIEVAYLDGMTGVQVSDQAEFNSDIVKVKVKHVVGVKPIDYRGLYKNPGV